MLILEKASLAKDTTTLNDFDMFVTFHDESQMQYDNSNQNYKEKNGGKSNVGWRNSGGGQKNNNRYNEVMVVGVKIMAFDKVTHLLGMLKKTTIILKSGHKLQCNALGLV